MQFADVSCCSAVIRVRHTWGRGNVCVVSCSFGDGAQKRDEALVLAADVRHGSMRSPTFGRCQRESMNQTFEPLLRLFRVSKRLGAN